MMPEFQRESILVVGATGFLGPALVEELCLAGFRVVCGVRNLEKAARELDFPNIELLKVDLNTDLDPELWYSRLQEFNIDRIVNNVGIATSFGSQSLENVNVRAPMALFKAMQRYVNATERAEKTEVIQISTTGVDWEDCSSFPYPRSKLEVDNCLTAMEGLNHIIIRPNVIYEPERGHLLLEQIARMPINFYIGHAHIQPVHCREVAIGVARLFQKPPAAHSSILRAMGPLPMTWEDIFDVSAKALGKDYSCSCKVPLRLAQGVTMLIQFLPVKILQRIGILSKMDPETIVMMTKGSRGDNAEWLQATGMEAISLDACYQAYANGTDMYAEFIKGIRDTYC
jgi:nucleoside-diphosphate-sugar epimerase